MGDVKCDICGRTFYNPTGLEQHMSAKHQAKYQTAPDKKGIGFKFSRKRLFFYSSILGVAVFLFWAVSGAIGDGGIGIIGSASALSDDDPFIGDENSPVTIVEFSDYQCPICQRFWQNTLPMLKTEYIDTGKVKLVYRDFPLTFAHPMAQISAEAANCVLEQGGTEAYFEFHDKMFGNQHALTNSNIIAWAGEAGYDISECLDSGRHKAEVLKDFREGQSAGATGTPSFFINGRPLNGAQPFSVFQQIIESELAGLAGE